MGKATRFTDRKEIRHKICEVLSGNIHGVDERVYANRTRPIGSEELPIVLIYPRDLDFTTLRKDPSYTHRRDLSMTIEVITDNTDENDLSDILDDAAMRIEDLLLGSDKLGGLVHDINIDTALGGFSGAGDKPEGSWTTIYNVTYIRKPKE